MMSRGHRLEQDGVTARPPGTVCGSALVRTVLETALAVGATRLSLATESDSEATYGLYRTFGFRLIEGLASLSLDLLLRSTIPG